MRHTLRKNWGGLSPHMSVCDSDGARRFLVKGRWFDLFRTRYLLCDDAGRVLAEIIQDHTIAKTCYSIYEKNVRIGSAGTNNLCSRGFIDMDEIGRVETALGHGLKPSCSLAGSHGVVAEITLDGIGWAIDVLQQCNHAHLFAGLAVLYGEYLRRD